MTSQVRDMQQRVDAARFGASGFWTWDAPMWDALRHLRDSDPVHWSEPDQLFVLSRFEDVAFVSKHNSQFCSGQGVLPGNPAKIGLIDEDEPRHTQLRRLINKGFTPRMVKKLEIAFRAITDETLDAVARRGECDFVDDIAVPLPLLLIAEMIGIRREDRERFHEWSDAMILAQGNMGDPNVMARAGQAFAEYAAYVSDVIAARRRDPQDDLISVLVHAKDEGLLHENATKHEGVRSVLGEEIHEQLSNDELLMFCTLLLVAGNETTRNGLSGAMMLLIQHPEVRARLLADPSLVPPAIEETLRLTSPVVSFVRTATETTTLRDQKIEQGQKVLMLYPAANRDERQFADPDRLDIDRNPHHLAFGIGNHFCLGANLARMELRVALSEVLRRMPDMEFVDGGPQMAPTALVRSFQHMRVRYTPQA